MESRPRTISQRKRIVRRKAKMRGDKRAPLGIPPKGRGWMGKVKIDK